MILFKAGDELIRLEHDLIDRRGIMFKKKIYALLIALVMIFSSFATVNAASNAAAKNALYDTAKYVYETVKNPQVGSVGGEWAIIGLARSEYSVPQKYYDDYYQRVVDYVKNCGGVLHDKKYTEYSRVILALTAIGKDPSNVGGYNLLTPLGDFDKTIWQGINGAIFALIALDSANYDIPVNKSATTQATREMYIIEILKRQLDDGGFALSGDIADPDITGMALQALAKYQYIPSVKTATDKALTCLSNFQDEMGGFSSRDVNNSESCVQVIVALSTLKIDINDYRFVKNGFTVMDALLRFYSAGKGFLHTEDGSGETMMSTEQGLYALAAYSRFVDNKNSLYDMTDIKPVTVTPPPTESPPPTPTPKPVIGLPNKHMDVAKLDIINKGRSFSDISNHKDKAEIEALASRSIINGITSDTYVPDKTMSRAEFATIVVKALGLKPQTVNVFKDVLVDAWYAPFIGTAYSYGIVSGTSADTFAPESTITKQEAAVMIMNAAKLCGIDTKMSDAEIKDMLAQFGDYTTSASWARNGLALCYKINILPQSEFDINPLQVVTRADIARMLYKLLEISKLL